ncbi:MAG: VanZ family protein [Candidatus Aenigmarchaeota archaeon]|nr:VanZ family protein [Candidatus Aenigmarchaeota archaeon]
MQHAWYGAAALLESAALLVLAVLPAALLPQLGAPGMRAGDAGHLLGYLLYGFLLAGACSLQGRGAGRVLAIGAGMGLLTEVLQLAVPFRTFDLLDWGVDVAGTALGMGVFAGWANLRGGDGGGALAGRAT